MADYCGNACFNECWLTGDLDLQGNPSCYDLVRLHRPIEGITMPGCVSSMWLLVQSLIMIHPHSVHLQFSLILKILAVHATSKLLARSSSISLQFLIAFVHAILTPISSDAIRPSLCPKTNSCTCLFTAHRLVICNGAISVCDMLAPLVNRDELPV